ncbi:MAG TPA: FMN-binding protein [Thermoanaerobaculaceae bacterium]|nr:FMN-binding protein [Thermoanaerobaculaceae bacterium]HRS15970.1 FMN-binding protein [Thermoanaerobaculaceae bacterium]
MSDQTSRAGFFRQSWLVLLLALSFGAALAAVEISFAPRIRENKRNATVSQIPELVPGAVKEASKEQSVGGALVYGAYDAEGRQVGWVVPAAGQGFADRIELLIGLDPTASTITGIYVLDQKETPGLGDYITSKERFRRYFEGQPAAAPLKVVKREVAPRSGEIRALTGATISSDAVTAIVNQRVRELGAALAQARQGSES